MFKYIHLVVIVIIVYGCNPSTDSTLQLMHSKPFDLMALRLANGDQSIIDNTSDIHNRIKLIIYMDSILCSTCSLKAIKQWQSYLEISQKYSNQFKILFICFPNKTNLNDISQYVSLQSIDYPVIIDTLGLFQQNNPHFPKDRRFHTFLLDENNEVILVGNPLHSKKLEEMYNRVIKEKLDYDKSLSQ